MQFTHEHQELQRSLKRFIDSEINPHVGDWETAEMFPAKELFKKMGTLGFLGIAKPPQFGGLGLDYSYAMAMAETLGYIHCAGVPMAIGVQTDMATPALSRFGSDVAAIKTYARKDGDDYVINGSKMWITNSLQADWMCLLANTSDDAAHRNKSLIIVPMDAKGVSVGKKIRKIGMNASDTGLIYFDDVRVPQRYRIGDEGKGFTYQMLQFQEERMWAAASNLQMLMTCIDNTIEYARERKLFGASLLDNQWVHFKLAELKTEVESLRALTYRACELYINGQDVTELASMAKLKAGRLARVVPDACLQFWGGMGYTWENPVSRFYRDGRLASIGGGADEVMLSIICKYMNTLPGRKD